MRDLVPADKLTWDALDLLRRRAEASAAYEVAVKNNMKVFNFGVGGSAEAECREMGLLVSDPDDAAVVVENLLLTTHLGVGANDRWITPACVIATPLVWIAAVVLGRDQALKIYGISCRDGAPILSRVNISSGPATLLAEWDIQRLYTSLTPEGYTDEGPLFQCSEAVTVTVLPHTTAAGGSELMLHAAFAARKGTFITK